MATKHDGIMAKMNAWLLSHGTSVYNRLVHARKERLFNNMSGRILEIGAGPGANLSYYSIAEINLTVLDPNPYMKTYFDKEAVKHNTSYEYEVGKAEELSFDDETFDHVVTTLVLCSVDNLEKSLHQIYRVLKPGGSFRFVEHVAAPENSWLYQLQRGINPIWKCLAEGCHPDRDTWKYLDRVGFNSLQIEHFRVSLPVVSPHIMGWAKKNSRN